MKVETRMDTSGGLQVGMTGESSHENAILNLLGRRSLVERYVTYGESPEGETTNLFLVFRGEGDPLSEAELNAFIRVVAYLNDKADLQIKFDVNKVATAKPTMSKRDGRAGTRKPLTKKMDT